MPRLGVVRSLFAKQKPDPVIAITITWAPGFDHQVTARDVTVTPDSIIYQASDMDRSVCVSLSKVDRVDFVAQA
jgi:hypothetical protein